MPCPLNELAGHNWTWVAPAAFHGGQWTSEHACIYQFATVNATSLQFESSPFCLADSWHKGLPGSSAIAVLSADGKHLDFEFADRGGVHVKHRGWSTAECSLIDMDDGSSFMRGYPHGRSHPMDFSPHEWLRVAAAWVVRSALVTLPGGRPVITPGIPVSPGAPPHYNGFWMRDGFYGISSGWPLVNASRQKLYRDGAELIFSQPRSDGVLPGNCMADGTCIYGTGVFEDGYRCNGTEGAPAWRGCQDLDTGSFAVKLAAHIWQAMESRAERDAWYSKWGKTLARALNATTRSSDGSGMVWSNTSRPQVGYGFQDMEVKSGAVLYSSVLYWNASRLLATMARASGDAHVAEDFDARANRLQASATGALWDDSRGVFMASTGLESDNVDVWGNAFAGASGFVTAEQSRRIFEFFKREEANIFYEGQVREIPFPAQWHDGSRPGRVDPFSTLRRYQNGGFWATPHHHVLPFLGQHDRARACRLLNATIASFRGHGIWEWVGPFWPSDIGGAPGYTASATNTYFASEHLRCWE